MRVALFAVLVIGASVYVLSRCLSKVEAEMTQSDVLKAMRALMDDGPRPRVRYAEPDNRFRMRGEA